MCRIITILLIGSQMIFCNIVSAGDWKTEANMRIENIRKGNANVKLLYNGKPFANTDIHFGMNAHLFPFGCCVNLKGGRNTTKGESEKYKELFAGNFNFAVPENHMKWAHVSRDLDKPDFEAGDEIVEFCKSYGIGLRGHCLTWEADKCYPNWVKMLEGDSLRDSVKKHIQRTVKHFGGYIREWDVDNELIHCTYVQKKLGERIVVDMHKFAEEADTKVRLFVNEYDESNPEFRKKLINKVKWMRENGAKIDGIGLQCHFNKEIPGGVENMKLWIEEISGSINLPVKLTEFDINDSPSEEKHAEDLESFYRMAFSLPQVEGILMWGFWEKRHWRPKAAIYRADFSPKPAADAYRKLVFDEWWTKDDTTKTNESGEFKFRGFYGDYYVMISLPDGKKSINSFKVIPGKEKYEVEMDIIP